MSSKYAYQLEEDLLGSGQDNREFGEQIRKQIKVLQNPIDLTQEAGDKITKQIESLERLANNTYGREYKRVYTSTATGLTAEQCGQVLSSEFVTYGNKEKKTK